MTDMALRTADLRSRARESRDVAAAATEGQVAQLPFRYLQQQAHLTAPANDERMARKSIESGFDVSRRLLERYGITIEALAERLEMAVEDVQFVVDNGATPLVILDLEDGVPPQLVDQARQNAVALFRDGNWGSTLRYFRPAGLEDPRGVDDIIEILLASGQGLSAEEYPVDGLVFPKIRHVHEVEWLYGILDDIEQELGLPKGRIRVTYQIETGWGVQNLADLARAGLERLSGVVLGTVDLAADILLPEVTYRHPVCEWVRDQIVTVAGAAGVPAIDGMTLNFPLALADASPEENRDHILERMRENFLDARYSIGFGMAGRWVGHPLHLLATMLAFRAQFSADKVAKDVDEVREFADVVESDRATAGGAGGELLDIGTDRYARRKLRQAAAWGLLDADTALSLGIVSADELGTAG